MIRDIRRKYMIFVMMIATAMIVIIFLILYVGTRRNLVRDSYRFMNTVLDESADYIDSPKQSPVESRIPYLVLSLDDAEVVVGTRGGYFDLSDEDFLDELVQDAKQNGIAQGLLEEHGLRYLSRKDKETGQTLIVYTDTSNERKMLLNFVTASIPLMICAIGSLFLLTYSISHVITQPVEEVHNRQRQFIANASHEIKTPLTVILANAELLREELPEEMPIQRGQADHIVAAGKSLRKMTEGLLDLSRTERIPDSFKSMVSLSDLIRKTCLTFEPVFFENHLSLETNIEEGLQLLCNADQLNQVVTILLDNAVKYATPDSVVSLRLNRQRANCLLAVASKGPEIKKEDRERIFDRFFRTEEARITNEGHGLGLSIARQLVEMHGGKIWAESESGTNRFLVQLPAR